jgi:flagella basal body P-ring formation protein FlgA
MLHLICEGSNHQNSDIRYYMTASGEKAVMNENLKPGVKIQMHALSI